MDFPWNVFRSPVTGDELYIDPTGSWLVDVGGTERWPVIDGIPDFISQTDPDKFGEMIRNEKCPQHHWKVRQEEQERSAAPRFAAEMAARPGTILEVASGPGGGFMPWTVLLNGNTRILAFDRSRMILEDWKELLDRSGVGDRVTFAVFDARSMPLRDGSIDTISSLLGIGNVEGWADVIAEIARVLKPGGRVYSQELIFNEEDWARLPEAFRAQVEQGLPTITVGMAPLFTNAGLQVIESLIESEYFADPEDSGIAKYANKLGVRLRAAPHLTIACKPESQ